MKMIKAFSSVILSIVIIFSGINVMALSNNQPVLKSSSGASFDTNKKYYIWLKEDIKEKDDVLSELWQLRYRWNINGIGNTFNAVVHLDIRSGENCKMVFKSDGKGYYGIRSDESDYWIDTEGNNTKTGEVLHQYYTKLKQDNQYFKFIPVSGEKDTYYIVPKKGDQGKEPSLYIGLKDNKIKRESKIATTDKKNAKKWVIKSVDDPMLTGKEVKLYGSKNKVSQPIDGAPTFLLNPEGYSRGVSVNTTGGVIGQSPVPNGNCLHLYYIGSTPKISAEWIESENAYRLRSNLTWSIKINESIGYPDDLVWDVDDESVDEGSVVHVWQNKGDNHRSQLWRFIPVEGKQNMYYIYNVNSSLYLALEKNSDENNVKLAQKKQKQVWEVSIVNQNDMNSYTTEKNNDKVNAGNWMSKLPDSMYLSEVNMPGTHDAGAARMLTDAANAVSSTLCQQLYINEQLNSGIRALDIRVDRANASTTDNPNIVHGFSAMLCKNIKGKELKFKEVMDTAKNFLATHPGETVIMTIKGDGKLIGSDDDIAKVVDKYISDSTYPIYRPGKDNQNKIPKLGEVRGKIVLIRRFGIREYRVSDYNLAAMGMDASKWDSNDYSSVKKAQKIDGCNIYAQDNYGEGDASKKLEYFYGTIDDATNKDKNEGLTVNGKNYLFNYSAATDNLSQPRDINLKLMKESRLNQPFYTDKSQSTKKTIGFVMANYIDPILSKRIYMTNFYECSHEYNNNGFCELCGEHQPAKLNADGIYEINNGGQLFWFASLVNGDYRYSDIGQKNQNAKAVLTKDINLENREWTPVNDFKGSFDGQNHSISNMKITIASSNVGLFGSITGKVSNLKLYGEIKFDSDTNAVSHIGGVVGYASNAKISNAMSYVNISSGNRIELKHTGGVIGTMNGGTTVENCMYYGNIKLEMARDCIGGVVGYAKNGDSIINCANAGSVTALQKDAMTGGVLGYVNSNGTILKNCYNYGKVKNGNGVSCGAVIGMAKSYDTTKITNNYYLKDSAPKAFGSGNISAYEKTKDEFKSGEVAYALNNKITNGSQIWYQNIDNEKTPDRYPIPDKTHGTVYLPDEFYYSNYNDFSFNKDSNGNFIIKTYNDLVTMAELVESKYDVYGKANYILTNNIVVPKNSEWTKGIGSASEDKGFNGIFDGNGYIISGMNINCPTYGGLFEKIGKDGTVKNLFFVNCNYIKNSEFAGGISAVNDGVIDHCISGVAIKSGVPFITPNTKNEIQASEYNSDIHGIFSGGVTALNNGTVNGCRNASAVTGTRFCGGIAGINTENGTVSGCTSNAKIGNEDSLVCGGLVGNNMGTIASSYSSDELFCKYEENTGFIAGLNSSEKVKDVFYPSDDENGFKAVGSDSTVIADSSNKAVLKSEMLTEKFVDELNSVADDSVYWLCNEFFNNGYPMIQGNFYKQMVKTSKNGVSIRGTMHSSVRLNSRSFDENDEAYNKILNYAGDKTVVASYQMSLTDANGNYIPSELWCLPGMEVSVSVNNPDKLSVVGITEDGNIKEYDVISAKDNQLIFNSDKIVSFVLLSNEKSDNDDNKNNDNNIPNNDTDVDNNNNSTDNNSTNNSENNSSINTGDVNYSTVYIILIALGALLLFITGLKKDILKKRKDI